MANFTATVWATPIVQAQLAGAGHILATMWPDNTPIPPTIANVSPSAGANIVTGTPWSAEISATLGELLCWVSYDGLNTVEMIYDGSDFCPNFKALSTFEELDVGVYRLTVRRSNGWLGSPRVFLRARTESGGVNASP